jgi:hypothetical protein
MKWVGVMLSIAIVIGAICVVGCSQEIPTPEDAVDTAGELALTYIDSAATYLGQGIIYILNLITGDRVSTDLEKPVGYLGLITALLLVFGIVEVARKVIWIGVIVGWVLLIVRIVLDALQV